MAVDASLVGARGVTGGSTITTAGGSVTTGDTLVAVISYDPGSSISSISDTAGNSYGTAKTVQTSGGGYLSSYVVENATGHASNVLTVNFSGTAYGVAHLIKVTGASSSSYDSGSLATAAPTTDPFTVTSGTLAQAASVVISGVEANQNGGTGAYSIGGSFTILSEEDDAGSYWTSAVAKSVVAATTAVTASWQKSGETSPSPRSVFILAFKEALYAYGHGLAYDFVGAGGSSITTPSFTSESSPGAILACVGRGTLSDHSGSSVSDNKSNTYSQLTVDGSTTRAYTDWPTSGTSLYGVLSPTGGSGHTVTAAKPDTSDEVTISAVAVPNGFNTVEDSAWSEDTTGPTNDSPSVTTAGAAWLYCWWWGDDSSGELGPPAASTGWVAVDYTSSLASNHVQCALYARYVSGAGTYSATLTPNTSQGAQMYVVAMAAASGGSSARTLLTLGVG